MPLDVLPPDDETFIKKKEVSNKQRLHLEKAREEAKKRLQKKKEEAEREKDELSVNDEEQQENEEEQEEEEVKKVEKKTKAKPKPKPRPKKSREDEYRYRTDEEVEEKINLEKFKKFMVQMNKYEEIKAKMKQEEEDKQKIHVKYTQEEYDELISLLEEKKNKTNPDVEKHNPVEPKKINKGVVPQQDYNYLTKFTTGRNNRTRFGR